MIPEDENMIALCLHYFGLNAPSFFYVALVFNKKNLSLAKESPKNLSHIQKILHSCTFLFHCLLHSSEISTFMNFAHAFDYKAQKSN